MGVICSDELKGYQVLIVINPTNFIIMEDSFDFYIELHKKNMNFLWTFHIDPVFSIVDQSTP